jgi:dUTP pyrophosphatase
VNINIKYLSVDAIEPHKGTSQSAGFDLVSTSLIIEEKYIEYGTDISLQIPEGYCGLLFPRSSLSKYDLSLCNSVGVIDSDYRGELKLRFNILRKETPKIYNVGDKVAQLVIIPIPNITFSNVLFFDDVTTRGSGGFGSTGT